MFSTFRDIAGRAFRGLGAAIDGRPKEKIIQRFVEKVIRVPANDEEANLARLFRCVRESGIMPKHVVDIGSHQGRWTRSALAEFPGIYVTMIEPQLDLRDHAKDLLPLDNIRYHAVGAGPERSFMLFTIHPRPDSRSFAYTKEEAEKNGWMQVEVPVIPLDEILAESKLPSPEIIKIDAEGFDLEVVKGGEKAIRGADLVLMEIGIGNRAYVKLEAALVAMRELGFLPFEITDQIRPPVRSHLWNIEMAFVRIGSPLDKFAQDFV